MTLRAGEIIESARFRHPQFTRNVIPTSVATQMLAEVQYQLLLATHQVEPGYLVQTWVISMRPDDNIATVGAGSAQGAPLIEGTVSLESTGAPVGALAGLDPTAAVLQQQRAVTGGGPSTLADTTQSWTTNFFAGQRVQLMTGPGAGQVREIASNTIDTLTVTEAWSEQPSVTNPAFGTTYQITQNETEVDGHLGVVMGSVPAMENELGWLVKLDTAGQPYLDLANPVSVPITRGIPLPPNFHIDHGKVRVGTGNGMTSEHEFTIMDASSRQQPPRAYCGWVRGQALFLAGASGDAWNQRDGSWQFVQTIEIPYLPLSPAITGASDVLIMPDAAREALVSALAGQMLERARQMGVAGAATSSIDERAARNAQLFINHVARLGRGTVGRIQEVW